MTAVETSAALTARLAQTDADLATLEAQLAVAVLDRPSDVPDLEGRIGVLQARVRALKVSHAEAAGREAEQARQAETHTASVQAETERRRLAALLVDYYERAAIDMEYVARINEAYTAWQGAQQARRAEIDPFVMDGDRTALRAAGLTVEPIPENVRDPRELRAARDRFARLAVATREAEASRG